MSRVGAFPCAACPPTMLGRSALDWHKSSCTGPAVLPPGRLPSRDQAAKPTTLASGRGSINQCTRVHTHCRCGARGPASHAAATRRATSAGCRANHRPHRRQRHDTQGSAHQDTDGPAGHRPQTMRHGALWPTLHRPRRPRRATTPQMACAAPSGAAAGPQRAELVGLLFVKNVRFPPKSPVGPSATLKTARFLE